MATIAREETTVNPDTLSYAKRLGVDEELMAALSDVPKAFREVDAICVELASDPEDEGAPQRVLFRIRTPISREAFRTAQSEFFAPFRTRPSKLYALLSVCREY